jgi:hypothetical protein
MLVALQLMVNTIQLKAWVLTGCRPYSRSKRLPGAVWVTVAGQGRTRRALQRAVTLAALGVLAPCQGQWRSFSP